MQWAMDVISEGGLDPIGIGYRSTIRVRLIHAFVRRHVAAMPDWRISTWLHHSGEIPKHGSGSKPQSCFRNIPGNLLLEFRQ